MEILEGRDDMKTITVEIEIYDDSTVEEVETALEFGLNDVGRPSAIADLIVSSISSFLRSCP